MRTGQSKLRFAGRTGAANVTVIAVVALVACGTIAAGATLGPAGRLEGQAIAAGDEAGRPISGQSGANLERPPTWRVRYDGEVVAERVYEVMRPGWHVHPGPAAILWDEGRFASGNYAVTSTVFLFPPGQGDPPSQVEAPYGLLLAGADLAGGGYRYVSFMLRNDGSFRVARHSGGGVEDVFGWREHEAIMTWTEASEGTAKNVLAVDATAESVTFWVNDQQVASVPRAEMPLQGIVGLRAGDGLSLHITDIAIGPNRR